MSRSINKVILLGCLGNISALKQINNQSFAAASLATSSEWIDKVSHEKKEKTEWHRLLFWGKIAEILGMYAKKGSKVYIEGAIQTRKYLENNIEKHITEIVVKELILLDSRKNNNNYETQDSENLPDVSGLKNYRDYLPKEDIPF